MNNIPLYNVTHITLSWVTLAVGFVAAALTARIDALMPVNFEHLTERVMLYIVFTFGEMVVPSRSTSRAALASTRSTFP